jgi:peptidoglycan/xylan/chitin deacetylase (PgdA/CDA1 family)
MGAAWCLPVPAARLPALSSLLRISLRAPLEDAVALTFDDGPHPRATPAVLEILRAWDARATFFVVGEQVRRNVSLLAEIVAGGHTIGIHADRHRTLLRMSPGAVEDDLSRAAETVGAVACGLHRAPYGMYSLPALRAVRRRGWKPMLWSRCGRDWRAQATPGSVTREVADDLVAGDVLLLHDADDYGTRGSWRTTVAALPRVLEAVRQQDLRVSAVPVPLAFAVPPA